MKLSIVSWNSTTDINNGTTFSAWYELKQQFVPTRSPIYSERPELWQKLSGASYDEHNFVFKVQCLGTIHSQRETVKGWFSPEDFTPHSLVFQDTADSNRQWYIEGICKRITEESPGLLAVTLATDEPFLRTVADSTGTLAVTSSTSSTDFTVLGNINAKPIFKITPNAAKTGDFGYSRWVRCYNPGEKAFSNYALDFGGVDTAALVSAGKMQVTGVDYLLQFDGEITDFWFGDTDGRGINTTDTALWGILDLAPRMQLPLKNAIGSTDTVTEVEFPAPQTLSAKQREMLIRAKELNNKVLLINNEAMTYSNIVITARRAYATITERGAKGTTDASHAANDTVRFLEHDIWQIYGSSDYSSASTDYYTVDDDNKPMFDLDSRNTSVTYAAFRQAGKARPRAWRPQTADNGKGNNCEWYTGDRATSTDPATDMGMKIAAYQYVNWRPDAGAIYWTLNDPGGIASVDATAERYLYNYTGTLWPALAGLQYLSPVTNLWTTAASFSIPTTSGSWEGVFVHDTGTGLLPDTSYAVRFAFVGSVYGAANNYAALEVGDVTINRPSNTIPQISVGSEQSRYLLKARIDNVTTGEWLTITALVGLGRTVTIDCNAKTVTLDDGTNLRAGLRLSSVRTNWLDLEPGSNTIRYREVAATDVTLGVEWENRNTL